MTAPSHEWKLNPDWLAEPSWSNVLASATRLAEEDKASALNKLREIVEVKAVRMSDKVRDAQQLTTPVVFALMERTGGFLDSQGASCGMRRLCSSCLNQRMLRWSWPL